MPDNIGDFPEDRKYLFNLLICFVMCQNILEVSTLPQNVVFLLDRKIRLKARRTLSTEAQEVWGSVLDKQSLIFFLFDKTGVTLSYESHIGCHLISLMVARYNAVILWYCDRVLFFSNLTLSVFFFFWLLCEIPICMQCISERHPNILSFIFQKCAWQSWQSVTLAAGGRQKTSGWLCWYEILLMIAMMIIIGCYDGDHWMLWLWSLDATMAMLTTPIDNDHKVTWYWDDNDYDIDHKASGFAGQDPCWLLLLQGWVGRSCSS